MEADYVSAFREQMQALLARPGMMDEARYAAFLAAQQQLGLVHGQRALCRHLLPYVLSYDTYRRVGSAAELVLSALERVAREALQSHELADYLGLSPEERELARLDPGYPELVTVGRLDMLTMGDGFWFIELNADSPAGLADQLLVNRTLLELPHLVPFRARHNVTTPEPHAALLNALRQVYASWSGGDVPRSIAIVDWAAADTSGEFRALAEWFSARDHVTVFADPRELAYENGRLWAKGIEIDLVYRRVIVDELLRAGGMAHPLITAYRERAVCVANSFRTKLVNKKAGLAVLSDPRFSALFTDEQRAAIAQHVPWTRRVDADCKSLVSRDREQLVLKPNEDYGGKGVLLGWTTPQAIWDEALETAGDKPLIVQERKHAATIAMPTFAGGIALENVHFDVSPFLFAGRMEGAMVRLSASALSNVSAGGSVSGLLIVDETSTEVAGV